MNNTFYKESVDIDKTQELPVALIYGEYVGYKKYSLIWKKCDNDEVLQFLKGRNIAVKEVKEKQAGEWSDRLGNEDHFYCVITKLSLDKISDYESFALELSYD